MVEKAVCVLQPVKCDGITSVGACPQQYLLPWCLCSGVFYSLCSHSLGLWVMLTLALCSAHPSLSPNKTSPIFSLIHFQLGRSQLWNPLKISSCFFFFNINKFEIPAFTSGECTTAMQNIQTALR